MRIGSRDLFVQLDESDLRTKVIVPLLQAQGYEDVTHTHGSTELGKDVVATEVLKSGLRTNYAVVAKAGRISGKNGLAEVRRQVQQALNADFRGGPANELRQIHKVFIMTNGDIPQATKDQLSSEFNTRTEPQKLLLVDGDELWRQWTTHFPVGVEGAVRDLSDAIARFDDPALTPRVTSEAGYTKIEYLVADPEKLTEEHTSGRIRFSFPDEESGKEFWDRWNRLHRTGEEISLSEDNMTIDFPPKLAAGLDEIKRGSEMGPTTYTISAVVDSREFPCKLILTHNDGSHTALDYVVFRIVRGGTDQVTFSNDSQEIPIIISFIVPIAGNAGSYTFKIREGVTPAFRYLQWMEIQRWMHEGGRIEVFLLESGLRLFHGISNGNPGTEAPVANMRLAGALARVESKLDQHLLLPDRELDHAESLLLDKLLTLLIEPKVRGTWSDTIVEVTRSSVAGKIDHLLNGSPGELMLMANEVFEFDGREYSAGPVAIIYKSVHVVDSEALRKQIDDGSSSENVVLEITPAESEDFEMVFLRWLAEDERASWQERVEQRGLTLARPVQEVADK